MKQNRIIILDIETTGLSFRHGHKIIEIACLEIIDNIITGNFFHTYLNPQIDIPAASTKIHGITNERVKHEPKFSTITQKMLEFIGINTIVAHNAAFDVPFINHELAEMNLTTLESEVIDTLTLAREKFPGMRISLDALCRKFNISLTGRKLHGALVDAQLLARVYLKLTAANQGMLFFNEEITLDYTTKHSEIKRVLAQRNSEQLSVKQISAHKEFIKKIPNALWTKHHT